MKTILKLFSNFLTLNDFAACTAYGIIAETEGGSKAVVEDVSADKETVERLFSFSSPKDSKKYLHLISMHIG